MWINFKAETPFMVKIYVGRVNAKVFGEHENEDAGFLQRLQSHKAAGEDVQDYVVVPPQQPRLDRASVGPAPFRQFAATPALQGYTVKTQMSLTGQEIATGLQFEITPAIFDPAWGKVPDTPSGLDGQDKSLEIKVRVVDFREAQLMRFSPSDRVMDIKHRIEDISGFPPSQQRLIFKGKQMQDDVVLANYKIQNVSCLPTTALTRQLPIE